MVTANRISRTFIGRSLYQFVLATTAWCWTPASRSFLLTAFVPQNTKTDLTVEVGRLHYSLRPTLSAHFRWCFGASERLNVAS